jgi:hypothetical protein
MQGSPRLKHPESLQSRKRDADADMYVTPRTAKRQASQNPSSSPGIGTSPLTEAPSHVSEYLESAESFGSMLPLIPRLSLFRSAGKALKPTPQDRLKSSQEVSPLRRHDADAKGQVLHPDIGLCVSGTMRVAPLQQLQGDTIGQRLVPALAGIDAYHETQSPVGMVNGWLDRSEAPLSPTEGMPDRKAKGHDHAQGLRVNLENPDPSLRPDRGLPGRWDGASGEIKCAPSKLAASGIRLQATDGLPVPNKAGMAHDNMDAAMPCQSANSPLVTHLAASPSYQLPEVGQNVLGHGAREQLSVPQVPLSHILEDIDGPQSSHGHVADTPKHGSHDGSSSSTTKLLQHRRSPASAPESSTNNLGGSSNDSWSSGGYALGARPSRLGLAYIPTVGSQPELTLALQGNVGESSLANPAMSSQSTVKSSGGLAGPLGPPAWPVAHEGEHSLGQAGVPETVDQLGKELGPDPTLQAGKTASPTRAMSSLGRVLEPISESMHNRTTNSSDHTESAHRSSGPRSSTRVHAGHDKCTELSPGDDEKPQVPVDEIEPHVEKLFTAMRRSLTNPKTGSPPVPGSSSTAPSRTLEELDHLSNTVSTSSMADAPPDIAATKSMLVDPLPGLTQRKSFPKYIANPIQGKSEVSLPLSADIVAKG